jgi:hypothetical protein
MTRKTMEQYWRQMISSSDSSRTHMWTKCLLVFGLSAPCWFSPYLLFAQTLIPVQAELLQRLNASKITVGDPILAKLVLPWKGPSCDLRAGAIIRGHVVTQKAYSKTEKTSEIGIAFESGQCGGRDMKPLSLTVAAVTAPYLSGYFDSPASEELQPLSSAIGLTLNGGLRSLSQASATVLAEPRPAGPPRSVKPGQILGIPHLAISVGQGPLRASIFRSTGRNVQLSPGTQFVLIPTLDAGSAVTEDAKSDRPSTGNSDPVPAITELPLPIFADEKELCEVPDCTVAIADGHLNHAIQSALFTLPLKGLGYLPQSPDREMSRFDYDASIAYLGQNQFLFTFDPHTLVPRSGTEAISFRKLRIIRGVLIDLEKKEIVKTVDWRVPDSGRYLWSIGENRVLIHTGQELRVYGPGLQLSNRISLGGPLAFVRISPASEYLAAGVIRERHTREIHRQVEEATLREPEEDVEIRLLDSQFRVLTTIMRSSQFPPPVLLNEGEVYIPNIGRNRWRIVENSWAGQRRVLAVAISTCAPQAESVPGNLLFVVGCDGQTGSRWYRILHSDGRVVLKGWSPSSELEQTAGGNVGSNAFAIRIVQATGSRLPQSVFNLSGLKSARVAVYRATSGRRIFSVTLSDPVPAVQTFAISPREDQLALLKAAEITFYRISAAE